MALAGVGTALVLAAGIVILGRLAPGVTLAMALTGAWFVAVAVAALALARRRGGLLAPMALGYVAVGAVAAVLLALPMVVDREVDERVVTADPAPPPAPATGGGAELERDAPAEPRRPRNRLLAAGRFAPREHAVRGRAALIRLGRGGTRLTLSRFEVDNGPDLRVYLVTGPATGEGDLGDVRDLGALKGNRGNQQYVVPARLPRRYDTVVIWCRAFSVNFAVAALAPE